MKVKDLLTKSSCTKYRVYTPNLDYVYIVNYLTDKPDYYGKQFCTISTTAQIPKNVLNLKVDLFSVRDSEITIYTEQKKKVRTL